MVALYAPKLRRVLCRVALLPAVALMVAGCGSEPPPELTPTRMPPPMTRVRLGPPRRQAVVTVQGKCQIVDVASQRLLRSENELSGALFTVRGEELDLDGRPLGSSHATIVSHPGGTVLIGRQPYRGTIHVVAASGKVLLVNVLNVEDYVASVVGGELYRHWHLECYKAQAIAARTYVLYQMAHRSAARPYDVTNSPASSQVYAGIEDETERGREAAEATRGIVLTYDDGGGKAKLFEAFYHSTCAGRTVPAWALWPKSPRIEPLSGVECSYCTQSPGYRWTRRFGARLLAERLRRTVPGMTRFDKITEAFVLSAETTKPGRKPEVTADGRVLKVSFRDTKRLRWAVPIDWFRRCLPSDQKLLSRRFSVALEKGDIVIHGRGNGHGVGMCQWGAQEQATRGRPAEAILQFYYPGSRLARVY